MLPTLFQHRHYKDVILARIQDSVEKGYKGKLATAAGCKNSYFSQVLNGPVHLTPEHAYGLASFWGFSESETEFFLLLVHYDRAGTKSLRQFFETKIDHLKKDSVDLAKTVFRHSQPLANSDLLSAYYSNWYGAAIHILLGIPGFQAPSAIAARLQLSETIVLRTLTMLQELGLAQKVAGKWEVLTYDIHLPKNSPLATPSHTNWRHRAIVAKQSEDEDALQFTAVNSVAIEDLPKLKQILLKAIEDYRATTVPSKEEELVCLTVDFFRV